jgi:1,3-beta-glucan synthase component
MSMLCLPMLRSLLQYIHSTVLYCYVVLCMMTTLQVFFMTRGGVSKASKGINLSEDIFAGYNNCIRGGQVCITYSFVNK